eukprot:CAMPEP_0119045584 /NCGR_PEP_ID=MMETSP1177-20130426/41015_1 /TAXON_ID=2985 /ORGANISM="Ochromonas sp, Strain CCMP1899" /LENGTH=1085 /DNA_ID=CAMNT_0007017609 /DNA_START=344 /DNA_END=3601 /DNA_ORIENTATION=+
MWERRAPISPNHVRFLIDSYAFRILVQPCSKRIFSNEEYIRAGAIVQEDLSDACLILGIKKPPVGSILENKSYMFFSHVIKAQQANLDVLDKLLTSNSRLFDYECIKEAGKDSRLLAFGSYAGKAGMIDTLQGLGLRLLSEGLSTPFLNVPMSFMHKDLASAQQSVEEIALEIQISGIPKCLIFAFTGAGNVSQGVRNIFELLPHEYITAEELPYIRDQVEKGLKSDKVLYGIIVTLNDLVRLKSRGGGEAIEGIDRSHYYANPDLYESIFHSKIAPYISVIVNGVYWDSRFPRLLTKDQLLSLRKEGNTNLKMVSDISCDVNGSIEFLSHTTSIEHPFFTYIPEKDCDSTKVDAEGILVLAVDILPSELPKDASEHFGRVLLPLLPPILQSKGSLPSTECDDLPFELNKACITSHGQLTERWSYINRLRELQAIVPMEKSVGGNNVTLEVELNGHLFDTGLINRVLDFLEHESIGQVARTGSEAGISSHSLQPRFGFSIINCDVQSNTAENPIPSIIRIQLTGSSDILKDVSTKVSQLVTGHESAGATAKIGPMKGNSKRVLLFGAGRVAKPFFRLLGQHEDIHITVASENEDQAIDMMRCMDSAETKAKSYRSWEKRSTYRRYNFPVDNHLLPELIASCDIAVSLLPASMHTPLAEEAVRHGKHFITASYTGDAMRALHDSAVANGVILLNEVGLDPGIDHMLVMKAVDSIHSRHGKVTELISLCGGLPDPEAANNPLRYKISWNPLGVLAAANNDALYLRDSETISVSGKDLLLDTASCDEFPGMEMEVLPNRDSLAYRDLYGVRDVRTIFRGTLRYPGWSDVIQSFKFMGLLSAEKIVGEESKNWVGLIEHQIDKLESQYGIDNRERGFHYGIIERLRDVLSIADSGVKNVEEAIKAFIWLGLIPKDIDDNVIEVPLIDGSSPREAMSSLLQSHSGLAFKQGERDMVAMFHTVVGLMPDAREERHTSRLLAFGASRIGSETTLGGYEGGEADGDSAMSETVGYTLAASVELVLQINPHTFQDKDTSLSDQPLLKGPLGGRTGVLIPTTPDIYEPILTRLKDVGITWVESVTVNVPHIEDKK